MSRPDNFYKTNYFFVGNNNMETINAYYLSQREPGGFIRAVLEGDLYRAAMNADIDNQQRLYLIARYIYNTLPSEIYGTPEKVRKWLQKN